MTKSYIGEEINIIRHDIYNIFYFYEKKKTLIFANKIWDHLLLLPKKNRRPQETLSSFEKHIKIHAENFMITEMAKTN